MLALLGLALAWAGDREAAEKLAAKAAKALQEGDVMTAIRLLDRADARDPNVPQVHFLRGTLLVGLAQLDPENAAKYDAWWRAELETVIRLAPDSEMAAISREGLGVKAFSLPEPDFGCPVAATTALDAAERAFAAGDLGAARTSYRVAIAGCPANGRWHVYLGDTWFRERAMEDAEREYRAALAITPCDPMAWRFLGDVLFVGGREAEAWSAVVRSAACDPTYQPGWADLRAASLKRGRALEVPAFAPKRDGTVTVAPGAGADALSGQLQEVLVWQAYDAAVTGATGSVLERRRAGVTAGLAAYHEELGVLPLWRTLGAAAKTGHGDAAIFLLLLDPELAPEFVAWRAEHLEESAAFIEQHLVK